MKSIYKYYLKLFMYCLSYIILVTFLLSLLNHGNSLKNVYQIDRSDEGEIDFVVEVEISESSERHDILNIKAKNIISYPYSKYDPMAFLRKEEGYYYENKNICAYYIGHGVDSANLSDGYVTTSYDANRNGYVAMELTKPTCILSGTVAIDTKEKLNISYWIGDSSYIYPYDDIKLTQNIRLFDENMKIMRGAEKTLYDGPSQDINTSVVYQFNLPNREVYNIGEGVFLIRRPLIYKLITPIIILFLIVLIIYIPFVKDFSTFCEISLAVLLGIWGAKQIVIPFSTNKQMLIENIFIVLYFLFSYSVLIKIFLSNRISYERKRYNDIKLLTNLLKNNPKK